MSGYRHNYSRTQWIKNAGCITNGVIIVAYFILCSWAVNTLLMAIWNTSVHWFWAGLGGMFLGYLAIPAAVIAWLLTMAGVV